MPDDLNDLVHAWTQPLEPGDREELQERILAVSRDVGVRSARSVGVPDFACEDVAQAVISLTWKLLRAERPLPTNFYGYIWRAGHNAGVSWHRRRDHPESEMGEIGDAAPPPEELWLDEEQARREKERASWASRLIVELLREAPDNYRYVIQRHHLDGVSIATIADEYTARRWSAEGRKGDPEVEALARKQDRNLVDQHLSRARLWLRTRLVRAGAGGGES